MQAKDLVNIHTSSVSKVLDIIAFALVGWRAAEDQEPEKVPTNLHVRHLTLISHSFRRDSQTTTWQSTTKNFTYALILHLTFHSGAKALSRCQPGKLPQVFLDTRELGAR